MMANELFDNRPKKHRLNRLPENPEKLSQGRFPAWLHRKLPRGGSLLETNKILRKNELNTVCEEAKCPNRLECYSNHTATFLALGNTCTRACGFCDIDFSKHPKLPDINEPTRIAQSVVDLGLEHVVITMVARDDLPDQGATHIAKIIEAIREKKQSSTIEILTSDFSGNEKTLDIVINAQPEIFNHNIETVRRLTPRVRHKALYERTLSVLQYVKGMVPFLKSGIMVGLGESPEEVEETIRELHDVGTDIITIGQYLQANHNKIAVKSFVTPKQFKAYETYGYQIGVPYMYSGPFIRSSYNAQMLKNKVFSKQEKIGDGSSSNTLN